MVAETMDSLQRTRGQAQAPFSNNATMATVYHRLFLAGDFEMDESLLKETSDDKFEDKERTLTTLTDPLHDASEYLDKHSILGMLQGLVERLVQEQPDDPYKFMLACLEMKTNRSFSTTSSETMNKEEKAADISTNNAN